MISSPFQSVEYSFSPFSDFVEGADILHVESWNHCLFSAVCEDIFTGTVFCFYCFQNLLFLIFICNF